MRTISFFAFALLLFLAACSKTERTASGQLSGTWKLVSISEKSTGTVYYKPAGAAGDIIISFSGGQYTGRTLKNVFSNGTYTLQNGTDVVFNMPAGITVVEDDWGSKFLTVLASCMLQSVSPCTPSKISFQGNKMIIESAMSYNLTLTR